MEHTICLHDQKAQKRRISKRVTAVKQTLKQAKVSAKRYIDYEPEDDLPDASASSNEVQKPTQQTDLEPTMYCETIDEERDKNESTLLSETANTLVKVAEQTKSNIEQILNGPKSTAYRDYYRERGKRLNANAESNTTDT